MLLQHWKWSFKILNGDKILLVPYQYHHFDFCPRDQEAIKICWNIMKFSVIFPKIVSLRLSAASEIKKCNSRSRWHACIVSCIHIHVDSFIHSFDWDSDSDLWGCESEVLGVRVKNNQEHQIILIDSSSNTFATKKRKRFANKHLSLSQKNWLGGPLLF